MSYSQTMKWSKKHPKGTRQPVLMSTGSGFWPSRAWIEQDFTFYIETCKEIETKPLDAETFYRKQTSFSYPRHIRDLASMTKHGFPEGH